MKDVAGAIVVFFVCLFAFTKLAGPIPFSVSSVVTQKTDTFSVSGEGKVTMVPDIAVVQAGVTAQGNTVTEVQNELNTKINAVSDAVKRLRVDEKDIRTTNYRIHPVYDYESPERTITGYEASSTLTIKIRDLDTANQVIDAATAGGANQIGGISFDTDDKTAAENQARELAVRDAKTKAEAAARTAGFSLGRIINYTEGGGAPTRPVMMEKNLMAEDAMGAPTQIEPGSSELTVTVSLSYEIR